LNDVYLPPGRARACGASKSMAGFMEPGAGVYRAEAS